MKQIGAKINSKVFCLRRSLRTFSPSFQLAKLPDEYHENESSDRLPNELNIPKMDELVELVVDELTDLPSFDLSAFTKDQDPVIDRPSDKDSAGELNDNFEFLLDKILEEFQSVDVMDMSERMMKMRQWKSKEFMNLYHLILPLIEKRVNCSSPKMGLFFMETETENAKIAKTNRLRSNLQPREAQEHRDQIRKAIAKLIGPRNPKTSRILAKPINFPPIQPNYRSGPSHTEFEDRLRNILELLDSPVDLESYLNYPEPSIEHSDSFFFDEWESWYQNIMKLVSKMDAYVGGNPDFDLLADRFICVDFLWPKDPTHPIPSVPLSDTYKEKILVPFFEVAGPVERNLPPSFTRSLPRLRNLQEPDYPMIFTEAQIAFKMGREYQNATGKIFVIYEKPEHARKAIQMFNSKRFCDFSFFDFVTENYDKTQEDDGYKPKSMQRFLNTDEYFNNFVLKVEKLSKKDFNSFMKYRDFDLVLTYSHGKGKLGKIFRLPNDSPIFQPGPHWKNLSMDRDPYRTDIYREKSKLLFNRDQTFKQRDEFQNHRLGDRMVK